MLAIKRYIFILQIISTTSLGGCHSAASLATDIIIDNTANRKCDHARDELERYQCEKQTEETVEEYNKR